LGISEAVHDPPSKIVFRSVKILSWRVYMFITEVGFV